MQVVGTSYFDTWANYQVGYDLLSQSRENNTSTVRFYGVLNVTGNQISWAWANASVWGTTWGLSGQYYRGSHTVVQQDVVITHNNDGTYSGTLSGTLSASWTGGTASGTFTLPKIARYPYLTSGTNFFDNTNPVYTISNPDTTHPVKVKLEAGGNTQLITRTLEAGYSGTYTLELTDAERTTLLALTPNSTTLPVVETVCAMNGDTELSWSYKNYTMTVDGYVIPFTATYEDTNSTTLAITNDDQQIIRNNSTLQINVTGATAMKEATLSTLEAEINGEIFTGTLSGTTGTINVGTLNLSSETRAKVYIYDSRGYGSMNPLDLEILNWETPTGIVNLSRQNNYYTDTDINVDANYSSLDNKNVLTLKVRSKKVGESTYGAYTTLQDNVSTTLQLDNTYQWDVQVLVQDLIGSTTYDLTIDRGIPIVFFDRKRRSMGINCFPENDTSLEVNGMNITEEINKKRNTYDLETDGAATLTGRKIDGKDEYVKRISMTSIRSAGTHTENLGFTLSDVLITKIDGVVISNSSNWFALPMGDYNSTNTWAIRYQLTDSTNTIDVTTANANFTSAYFEIYYISLN